MKKLLVASLILVAAILGGLWTFAQVPAKPSITMVAEVVKLEDVRGGKGRRLITVRFADGQERTIETLAPFFFKPGYKAKVGIFERTLFPDVYDIVSDSTD
ncbi:MULTISPECIES: hypothetical protein [Kordiimonas]|jgi:hypothetical protein|uniref:hypothetical protein n=1 Tax=Kordiimonas TaxID=288021 RepID=UPI00257FD88F|nr:hypothetical protein [Kordiimonas sp. UBA4487]